MWAQNFSDRLIDWNSLRQRCSSLPPSACLLQINQWWNGTPWTSYYLHWDDRDTWPNPWQLLEDNIYCSVARALGMLYTIAMLDRHDMQDTVMIDDGNDNLVLVRQGKYILNWSPDTIVNINPGPPVRGRMITQQQIKNKID